MPTRLAALLAAAGLLWMGAVLVSRAEVRSSDRQTAVYRSAPPGQTAAPDFAALTAACPGAVAWLELEDVPVSGPVMQAEDNEFYLRRGPDGEPLSAGSLFLDAGNTGFEDPYALVYGHHMRDGSRFAPLTAYAEETFYRGGTGRFTLYTPDGAAEYQIFAVLRVEPDDEVFTLGFARDAVFADFVQMLRERSLYDTGVEVTGQDTVLSLCTCATADGGGRLVVCARRLANAE